MKALVKKFSQPGLWLDDVPEPTLNRNDVLVKIHKTAICGTDLHIYNWDAWAQKTIPVPMHVGHEFVGEIIKLGPDVQDFSVGDIVSGEGHLVCGNCRSCRAGNRHLCIHTKGIGVNIPGCFAEYLSIPAYNVFLIPKGISKDEAAILDPLGNAVHTTLSFDIVGEDVLITGAGPIGIMAAAIAKHIGARHVVITDINEDRIDLAKQMGIKSAINVKKTQLKDVIKNLGMTEGFDVSLEMSGNPTALNDIINHTNHGGKIALLGILPNDTQIAWDQVIFKSLQIKGIYGREIFGTWYKMCAMIQSGLTISPIFTHRFHYSEFAQAFAVMNEGKCGKVLLNWIE